MADAVLLALEEQVGCCRRLAKLAVLQHEHVQQGQTESLIEVLRQRQEVLEDLKRLDGVVGPANREWSHYLSGLDAGGRSRAERLMVEKRGLLEQITTADRDDAMVLQQQKLNLGKQIHQATSAKQVNRNYAAAAYGTRAPRMDIRQ